MATSPIPTQITPASSQLSSDQLTVILASISCLVFFLVILGLLSILYQRDSFCCKTRTYQDPHRYPDTLPQYYNSRQTLMGTPCNEQGSLMAFDNAVTQQPGQLFLIGQPSNYQLNPLETPLPYLPSYESVRKKDRQQQIHMMIAERFGLSSPVLDESPPTYEESVRQSVVVCCSGFGAPDGPSAPVSDSHHREPSAAVREAVPEQHSAPDARWAPLPV